MTVERAVEALGSDVAMFVDKVSEVLPAGMSQHQFDAAVILSQNIGEGAFAGSSAAAPINNPGATTPYPSLEGLEPGGRIHKPGAGQPEECGVDSRSIGGSGSGTGSRVSTSIVISRDGSGSRR